MAVWRQRIGWGLLVAFPLLALLALLNRLVPDPLIGAPRSHFIVVSITVSLLAALALLFTVASLQVRDIRVFFLALTFLTISGIFLTHALTTPGALIEYNNPWIGFSAYFALFLGALTLGLSALRWPRAIEAWIVARQGLLFAGVILALGIYNAVALRLSATPPAQVVPGPPGGEYSHVEHLAAAPPGTDFGLLGDPSLQRGLALLTALALRSAVWRYSGQYRLGRSPLIAGLLAASTFLLQAQVVMLSTTIWHASWWGYHLLILSAFAAAALGLARECARSGTLAGVVGGLLLRDTIRQLSRSSEVLLTSRRRPR